MPIFIYDFCLVEHEKDLCVPVVVDDDEAELIINEVSFDRVSFCLSHLKFHAPYGHEQYTE